MKKYIAMLTLAMSAVSVSYAGEGCSSCPKVELSQEEQTFSAKLSEVNQALFASLPVEKRKAAMASLAANVDPNEIISKLSKAAAVAEKVGVEVKALPSDKK